MRKTYYSLSILLIDFTTVAWLYFKDALQGIFRKKK